MAAKDDPDKEQKKILGKQIRETAKAKVIHTYIRVKKVREDMGRRRKAADYNKSWRERNKKRGDDK